MAISRAERRRQSRDKAKRLERLKSRGKRAGVFDPRVEVVSLYVDKEGTLVTWIDAEGNEQETSGGDVQAAREQLEMANRKFQNSGWLRPDTVWGVQDERSEGETTTVADDATDNQGEGQ